MPRDTSPKGTPVSTEDSREQLHRDWIPDWASAALRDRHAFTADSQLVPIAGELTAAELLEKLGPPTVQNTRPDTGGDRVTDGTAPADGTDTTSAVIDHTASGSTTHRRRARLRRLVARIGNVLTRALAFTTTPIPPLSTSPFTKQPAAPPAPGMVPPVEEPFSSTTSFGKRPAETPSRTDGSTQPVRAAAQTTTDTSSTPTGQGRLGRPPEIPTRTSSMGKTQRTFTIGIPARTSSVPESGLLPIEEYPNRYREAGLRRLAIHDWPTGRRVGPLQPAGQQWYVTQRWHPFARLRQQPRSEEVRRPSIHNSLLWPTRTNIRSRTRTNAPSNNPTTPPDGAMPATTAPPQTRYDCFADTLRAEKDQQIDERRSANAKIRVPRDKPATALAGRTPREVRRYARGRLYGYSAKHGEKDLKEELSRLGHGSWALIIAEHPKPLDSGIGAHTYRMRNKNGRIETPDAHPNQNPKVLYAILYDRNNKPIKPHQPARASETIPPFPRKTRIGAPEEPADTHNNTPPSSPSDPATTQHPEPDNAHSEQPPEPQTQPTDDIGAPNDHTTDTDQLPRPPRWAFVYARTDPLFKAIARILDVPDAAYVRACIINYIKFLEERETADRAGSDRRRRHGASDVTPWEQERTRRREFDEKLDRYHRAMADIGAHRAEPQRETIEVVASLATDALQFNLVVEHPDQSVSKHTHDSEKPSVFLRYRLPENRYKPTEKKHAIYAIGVTPEGGLFATHTHPQQPPPLSSLLDDVVPPSEIPPPLTRVLASPHIPLLGGVAMLKDYARETRPIPRTSHFAAIPNARPLARARRNRSYTPVRHMSPEELENHRLFVRNGKLYRVLDGRLFDTTRVRSKHSLGTGLVLFAMDEFGNLYAAVQETGFIHHSSFFGGRTGTAFGEIVVRDGALIVISTRTGHYKTPPANNDYALDVLRHQGLELDSNFTRYGRGYSPRNRVGELGRQRGEVERRQIDHDAATTALTRILHDHNTPDSTPIPAIRDLLLNRRKTLDQQHNELTRWRRGLSLFQVQPDLQHQLYAHPDPTGPNDRITPPQPPAGLDTPTASDDAIATWWHDTGQSWWDHLHFIDLSPGYQHQLLTDYPGLRTNDGIPAPVRDTLNIRYAQLEIQRLNKLWWPTSSQKQQRHQLRAALTDLHTADLNAAIAAQLADTEQPTTRLLSLDHDTQQCRSRVVIGFGPVDTARTVHW
ncbi:MAG: hypothetical protein J2P17_06855, partial [Mycobacterium sp.]|nr:hypothetical protein [Mycobacterium sp.]